MGYYISPAGQYYTGEQNSLDDISVTERPALDYKWDGTTWVKVKTAFNTDSDANKLHISDLGMARVLEDLIDVLIAKGILSQDDLPDIVWEKIRARETIRGVL